MPACRSKSLSLWSFCSRAGWRTTTKIPVQRFDNCEKGLELGRSLREGKGERLSRADSRSHRIAEKEDTLVSSPQYQRSQGWKLKEESRGVTYKVEDEHVAGEADLLVSRQGVPNITGNMPTTWWKVGVDLELSAQAGTVETWVSASDTEIGKAPSGRERSAPVGVPRLPGLHGVGDDMCTSCERARSLLQQGDGEETFLANVVPLRPGKLWLHTSC